MAFLMISRVRGQLIFVLVTQNDSRALCRLISSEVVTDETAGYVYDRVTSMEFILAR